MPYSKVKNIVILQFLKFTSSIRCLLFIDILFLLFVAVLLLLKCITCNEHVQVQFNYSIPVED